MEKIIEDSNPDGWKHLLREGCGLIQESDTRFGTYYRVAERFLKASVYVSDIAESHLSSSARSTTESLKKHQTSMETLQDTPALKKFLTDLGWSLIVLKNLKHLRARHCMRITIESSNDIHSGQYYQWKQSLEWRKLDISVTFGLLLRIVPYYTR